MKSIKMSLAALAVTAGLFGAIATTAAPYFAETQKFYLDPVTQQRTDVIVPANPGCINNPSKICYATFTRPDASSQWTLVPGSQVQGQKP